VTSVPSGAAGRPRVATNVRRSDDRRPLRTAVVRISRAASVIGMIAMGVMVLHITVDVALRLFGIALPGTVAFVANYYMLFVTFLPLVAVEVHRSHIEVEVVAQNFPATIQALLRLCGWIVVAGVLAFLGWEASHEAMRAYRARMFIIEQSVRIETWIPYFTLPVGYFLAATVATLRVALTVASLSQGLRVAVARAERYFSDPAT